MSESYSWWPTSSLDNSEQAFADGAILAAYQANRYSELTPSEQARLVEILEMQHDEAFTQSED